MKKRQRNKLMKKFLSEKELKVIELYRQSDSVDFYKFDVPTCDDAVQFCGILGTPHHITDDNNEWFKTKSDNVRVVSFLSKKEVINND
ncbi:hypothetical protein [Brochothrix thermosphacta]|uniref:hypothetical protein n=1 Tax=Brochothrix thermosphacta TaxID=2756 RepID=UPI00083F7E18|nr:hypothetical protein [Brochothrix thermosphacta]ODJ72011.1 hypothetical protein BFR39_04540 [Brochothrix thermosphacta]